MSKSLTPKQKKIANAAEPKDKITGADFKALKKKPKKKKAHPTDEPLFLMLNLPFPFHYLEHLPVVFAPSHLDDINTRHIR